jgi:DNA-binding NtrC family response regulator
MLRSEGHLETEVSNLGDARRALSERGSIDLVLSDIGLGAAELAAEIAATQSNVRMLFMTGGGPLGQHTSPALNHDDRNLLAKPFSRQQLVDEVQQALGRGAGGADVAP